VWWLREAGGSLVRVVDVIDSFSPLASRQTDSATATAGERISHISDPPTSADPQQLQDFCIAFCGHQPILCSLSSFLFLGLELVIG